MQGRFGFHGRLVGQTSAGNPELATTCGFSFMDSRETTSETRSTGKR